MNLHDLLLHHPMFQLSFCHPPNSPFTLNFDSLSLTGFDLKLKLQSVLPGNEGAEGIRLVCGGKVVQDQVSLEGQGIGDKAKIYISIKKEKVTGQVNSAASAVSARKPESDPLMAPLLKFLSDNPELYQQMLMSNPQMQKLIEKNPELRHALSDPSTLKSMLNAASNPTAYNEMLRGHDRAMSNLENIPEGFSHLKKVYSTLQEPMYDALTPPSRARTKNVYTESTGNNANRMTTREPVPNPWAPPAARPVVKPTPRGGPVFGFKAHPHKRKHSIDEIDDMEDEGNNEEIFGKLSGSIDAMRLLSPLGSSGVGNTGKAASTNSTSSSNIINPLNTLNPNNLSNLTSAELAERFRTELEVLHQLGFEDDAGENIPALLATGGHVSAAIDRILQRRGI